MNFLFFTAILFNFFPNCNALYAVYLLYTTAEIIFVQTAKNENRAYFSGTYHCNKSVVQIPNSGIYKYERLLLV